MKPIGELDCVALNCDLPERGLLGGDVGTAVLVLFSFANERSGTESPGMNLAELESKVLQLPEEERREFAAWFYEHEDEIAGPASAEAHALSDEQKAELTRRLLEIEQHPEML